MTTRRFSGAISEGDGISVIVPVDGPDAAQSAETEGAEAVVVSSGRESRLGEIRAATTLPIVFFFDGEGAGDLAGADACVVDVIDEDPEWLDHVHSSLGADYELALRITDDERLRFVLESFDPELLVLAVKPTEERRQLDAVLELLQDVPAGKLAIAQVEDVDREGLEELERAGMDAVIVAAGTVAALVGAAPPEV